VRGEICTICCGTEREVSVDCPLDCPYLQEARKHERASPSNAACNPDIEVTEEFLQAHEPLLVAASRALMEAAFETPGAVDQDARDALDALIRTHRTLQSGVYYETRPEGLPAKRIYGLLQTALEAYSQRETEGLGVRRTRPVDVLGILVFLARLEMQSANGRPRGRAFLDFVRSFLGAEDQTPAPAGSLLIRP
jgi:hypothetical protein